MTPALSIEKVQKRKVPILPPKLRGEKIENYLKLPPLQKLETKLHLRNQFAY